MTKTVVDPALLETVAPERVRNTTGMDSRLPAGGEWVQPMSVLHLARAEAHYASRGYSLRAVPWIISRAAYDATRPAEAREYSTIDGFLVASAEQSYMQMMMNGVALGRVQTLTPCFRNEVHDELHLPYFLKLELIDTTDVSVGGVEHMLENSVAFFSSLLPVEVVESEGGSLDIVSEQGVELGSYGLREMEFEGQLHTWVYGTGCAEPRLSQAITRHQESVR